MRERRQSDARGKYTVKKLSTVLLLLAAFILFAPGKAHATEIWGRIIGLGDWRASNYIARVDIVDDHGERYQGRAAYSDARGGLYWTANVPTWRNRSYQVLVYVTDPNLVIWNPATAYGSWFWGNKSAKCNDVRFYLRGL
jgi:hypothetical protein